MVYLVTNITDGSSVPMRILIGDVGGRIPVELDPGETIDLEILSNRNQICQSLHIRSHLHEGRITVDTLGTDPECRLYVDAVISSGDINVGTVTLEEPLLISANVGGVETPLTGITVSGHTYLDVRPLLPSQPNIANILIPSANTEYAYPLPINAKKFAIRVREGDARMKIAYAVSETNTKYLTVRVGTVLSEEGVDAGTVTIYFQIDKPNRTVEVVSWAI
jgi:hypothetical protein